MAQLTKTGATAVFLLLFGGVASAQLPRLGAPRTSTNSATTGVVSPNSRSGQGMIHGTAVDGNSSPIRNAEVRLRNLDTGTVEKISTANLMGEFTFVVQPEIPYVVEIADQAGQIVGIGTVVTAQAGEVAGSVVAVPGRLPALSFLGDTAGSVTSVANATGITPVEPSWEPPPASPEQ